MKPPVRDTAIEIDFGSLVDHPISHDRLAIFNSGLVTADTYRRDATYFERTRPEHLRIDLGWGAEWMPGTRELVTLGTDGPHYDFTETDEIAKILRSVGVRPYWSYCYVPTAVRAPDGDWRTIDLDDNGWVALVREYARGAGERGVEIGYHEVYNEPDLRDERTGEPVFFAGTLNDYLDLYRATATAIRAVDPTAMIGGPALASVGANADWLRPFLDMVATEGLPLDFLSFHHYGTYGLQLALDTVVGILAKYEQFDHVELHLNEYNSFTIDYPRGGLQDTHLLAGAFAEDAARFLSGRRLTRISWAQFLDSGNDNYSGMVSIDGTAKPVLHTYEFLQHMPNDRRRAVVAGAHGVGALASSDGRRAAAMIWNRSSEDQTISLTVTHAPGGDAHVRMIDAGHVGEIVGPFDGRPLQLSRGAVACLEWGAPADSKPARRSVLRARYDYADRTPGAWTDVDEIDGTVRFGTGPLNDAVPSTSLRVGYDVRGSLVPQFEHTIVFADGALAPGVVDVSIEPAAAGDATTLWFTLSGAPACVFARSTPVRQRSDLEVQP